jgi:hypothetical protein
MPRLSQRSAMISLVHHSPQSEAKAWVYGSDAYPLPDGLAHGSTVTFIRHDGAGLSTVRDANGREFSLPSFHLDFGNSFFDGREWMHESREESITYFNAETERCLPQLGSRHACAGTEKHIAWMQRLLRRNDRPFTNEAARAVAEGYSFASVCYAEPGHAMNP